MFYPNYFQGNFEYKIEKINNYSSGINCDNNRNVLGLSNASMAYNFGLNNDVIIDGVGVKDLEFRYSDNFPNYYKKINRPSDNGFIIGCWFFSAWTEGIGIHRPFLIVYTTKGNFYYNRLHIDSGELVQLSGLNFTEKPIVTQYKLNGVDTLLLVSKADGMYTWTYPNTSTKIENAPSISSMCIHNDRLFITTNGEKRSIMFSDNPDPTNFNLSLHEGGIIDIVDEFGSCNKVVSFDGYVYIFRDFNIAKLTTYDDKNDFTISQLYVSNGRIYDKTVCICGNKILYLASDGIYQFNGNSATKLNLKIDKILSGVDNSYAVAGYSNGCYYLSCRLNFNDDRLVRNEDNNIWKFNNALIKVKVDTGEMSILRGYDIIDISVINDLLKSEVVVIARENTGGYSVGLLDDSGMYFDTPTSKLWQSGFSDLDKPEKVKVVKEISLETSQDITLRLISELGYKDFEIKGKTGYQTIKSYFKGKRIALDIMSENSNNYISNIKIKVGY